MNEIKKLAAEHLVSFIEQFHAQRIECKSTIN